MRAWVAVTDWDWFSFLRELDRTQGVDEVNFWQPNPWRGRFGVLSRGQPLLFKLKSPRNAIAGVGFFEDYLQTPLSLAWRSFGLKNGAADQQECWNRVARLRKTRPPWWEDFEIGCILLSQPSFWPEELWISQPDDFPKNTEKGKGYDLTQGTGKKLWDEVLLRLEGHPPNGAADSPAEMPQFEIPLELPGGYAEGIPGRRRVGQGTFELLITEAYGRQCAVTREKALPALDAAHIRPFKDVQRHELRNGLLLRSDVHRLFDAGYITVTPEHRIEASSRMRDDFHDGDNYLRLHGESAQVPHLPELQPDPDALRWHNEERFRG